MNTYIISNGYDEEYHIICILQSEKTEKEHDKLCKECKKMYEKLIIGRPKHGLWEEQDKFLEDKPTWFWCEETVYVDVRYDKVETHKCVYYFKCALVAYLIQECGYVKLEYEETHIDDI